MTTGTGCRNAPSALHRLPPIADALPYAAVTPFLVRFIMQDPGFASLTSGIHAVSPSGLPTQMPRPTRKPALKSP